MLQLAAMTSVCPDYSLEETIAALKRYGYTGLEPRVDWGHKQGIEINLAPAARQDIRANMQQENLSICCIATGLRLATPDESEQQSAIETLHQTIDFAGDLGCPTIRVFGGAYDKSTLFKAVVEHTANGLRQVISHAKDRQVTVLLETHDWWCRSQDVRAVVDAVNDPAVAVLWDLMHPQLYFEPVQRTFDTLGALTRHVHVHDGFFTDNNHKLELCALDEGMIDHAKPLQLLKQAGYSGFTSVEIIHKPGSNHDAEGVLKQYAQALKPMIQ